MNCTNGNEEGLTSSTSVKQEIRQENQETPGCDEAEQGARADNMISDKVPRALKTYQENMGGTDCFDQIVACGGGGVSTKGTRKLHKWFKTISLAITYIGMANSSIAWSMKAETDEGQRLGMYQSPIFKFQTVLANQLLYYMHNKRKNVTWLQLSAVSSSAASSLSATITSSCELARSHGHESH